MSKYIPLEQMDLPANGPPEWTNYYGPDIILDRAFLDRPYDLTRHRPLEERNELLKIMWEEVISRRNHFRSLEDAEKAEAWALCSKYNDPETGLIPRSISDYKSYVSGLETRFPLLAALIKEQDELVPLMRWWPVKLVVGDEKPTVLFNHGWYLDPYPVESQGFEVVKDHLIKKAALLEKQTQILTRALEENGIQIPQEFTAIRSQIDAPKHFSSAKPAQAKEDQEGGEQQSERLNARPVALFEDSSSSTFRVDYEVRGKPRVFDPKTYVPPPPPRPPPEEMEREDLQEFLKSMRRFKSGKFFETLATQERSDKYDDLVRDHRDLATIKTDLESPTYRAQAFFEDIRLMLDNYARYFDEGSDAHKMVELFQEAMFKKLDEWGEAGQTAKDQFNNAPRAKFNEIIASPKADETFQPSEENDLVNYDSDDQDEAETSFAQGVNNDYDENYGEGGDDSYFGKNDDVLENEGDRGHFPQTPGTVGPARKFGSQGGFVDRSPSVPDPADQSLDEDERIRRTWGSYDVATQWNQAHGLPTRAPAGRGRAQPRDKEDGSNSPSPGASGPAEQRHDNDSESDSLSSVASPIPSPASRPATVAGEPGDEDAHAGAHAVERPAPIAPMSAEQELIDLTSSPSRQTSNVDRASTKRARASEDQDSSSDDDTPLVKRRKTAADPSSDGVPLSSKRQKTAAKSTGYAVTPSLGKRSRDDSNDGNDKEERGPPSKRNKASPVPEPQAPASAAAGDNGVEHTSLTIDELFEPFESPPPPVQEPPPPMPAAAQGGEPSLAAYGKLSNIKQQDDQLPPSPIPEPLTPPAAATEGPGSVSFPMLEGTETRHPANDASGNEGHESRPRNSSPIAAADEPQPEPSTENLGHTINGATTASNLQKRPKYKKKGRSNGLARPSRPWVFGHRFGNDYGLYIMSCPKKGCETGLEVFTTHPLMRNDAADHLQECENEFADDDDMVRKYGTQVISDDRKTVSIEWARNWNNELMKEYGNEEFEEDNF